MSFNVGDIVKGTVTGITNFGAFIKLPDDKTGLCHISEIADEFVKDVKEHLKEGQEVTVKVLKIKDDNKIELSIKAAIKKPERKPDNRVPKKNNYERPKPKPNFENMLADFLKTSEENQRGIKQRDQRK